MGLKASTKMSVLYSSCVPQAYVSTSSRKPSEPVPIARAHAHVHVHNQ